MKEGTVAIIVLCILLAFWYGLGYVHNRRRGRQLMSWLVDGVSVLGGQSESGWIGSSASGARVNITRAAPPFRRMEITLLLENREIPFLWLADYLRGRRDRIIIKATLRSPQRGQIEVGSARRKAARRREQPWSWQDGPHGLAIAYQGHGAQRWLTGWLPWLEKYGAHIHRLSCHKSDPHVQIHVNLANLLSVPAAVFFNDLQAAAVVESSA